MSLIFHVYNLLLFIVNQFHLLKCFGLIGFTFFMEADYLTYSVSMDIFSIYHIQAFIQALFYSR